MNFGKESSFVFCMQDSKLVNVGRLDVTADRQPFDDVEEEVWRIFGEHKTLEAENKLLREPMEVNGFKAEGMMAVGQALIDNKMEIAELEVENKRLREFIEKHHPPNRHDHDYFHNDCSLCKMEKQQYEEVKQTLKNETTNSTKLERKVQNE